MFTNLSIFKMSHAMAKHSGARQAIVAENVANSDTPNYRARRLPSFADVVKSTDAHGLKATRAGHLFGSRTDVFKPNLIVENQNPSPNGNSVSIEREMLESVNIKREHDRALSIYRSALRVLQSSLGKG